MTENPRQEIDVEVGGQTYAIRPTMRVIAQIERAIKGGLPPALKRIEDGGWSFSEIETILWIALNDLRDSPKREALQESIEKNGIEPYLVCVMRFGMVALKGSLRHGSKNEDGQENQVH